MFQKSFVTILLVSNAVKCIYEIPINNLEHQLHHVLNSTDIPNSAAHNSNRRNFTINKLEIIESFKFREKDYTTKHINETLQGLKSFHVNPQKKILENYKLDSEKGIKRVEYASNFSFGRHLNNLWSDYVFPSSYNENNDSIIEKRGYAHHSVEKSAVSKFELRQFPYVNVVKLSSGCTGTLLTPIHVLTAAHCVHDGKAFKHNMEMLKVEVPGTIGYRVHYIVKINVPVTWLESQNLPDIGRGAYDYAVLQLNIPVGGRNKFMQLALPNAKMLDSALYFLSFVQNKSFLGLWKSTCAEKYHLFILDGNVVLKKCHMSAGNSGAAAFINNAVDGEKIIGLLSNTISTSTNSFSMMNTNYEAVMLLTLSKCLDICTMIHPEGEKYHVCEIVKRNNRKYLQVASNRIVPFFG